MAGAAHMFIRGSGPTFIDAPCGQAWSVMQQSPSAISAGVGFGYTQPPASRPSAANRSRIALGM